LRVLLVFLLTFGNELYKIILIIKCYRLKESTLKKYFLLLILIIFFSCNNPDDNTFAVRGRVRFDHDEYIDILSRLATMYSDKWKFAVYCEADYNWDFCWYPGRGSREKIHGIKWNESKKRYTMDITQ